MTHMARGNSAHSHAFQSQPFSFRILKRFVCFGEISRYHRPCSIRWDLELPMGGPVSGPATQKNLPPRGARCGAAQGRKANPDIPFRKISRAGCGIRHAACGFSSLICFRIYRVPLTPSALRTGFMHLSRERRAFCLETWPFSVHIVDPGLKIGGISTTWRPPPPPPPQNHLRFSHGPRRSAVHWNTSQCPRVVEGGPN